VVIHLLQTDGTQRIFDEWLTDPDWLKYYIGVFNQPSSSVKPLQAIFVLKNYGPFILYNSEGTQNNLALHALLSYVHSDSKQK